MIRSCDTPDAQQSYDSTRILINYVGPSSLGAKYRSRSKKNSIYFSFATNVANVTPKHKSINMWIVCLELNNAQKNRRYLKWMNRQIHKQQLFYDSFIPGNQGPHRLRTPDLLISWYARVSRTHDPASRLNCDNILLKQKEWNQITTFTVSGN